ncbi:hypothetical protein [Pseudonocardia sp. TRM90224]|uniref:hypothetical protein n=1 Tax=Pseudonocardia sp. TRM90224 TaxID=2812678 RepID=UPI001E2854A5|nr:hypothetical protein [Pseudonocardia sp. TRM90224]
MGAYTKRLEGEPSPRWAIDDRGWREPLGDPSRLGDWLQFFGSRVHDRPWEDLLAQWWPRLLPGAIASSTHGLIRTGHAVRALREHVTPQRLDELGQALGYWAARWQPLHGDPAPSGTVGVDEAMERLPVIEAEGGTRTRLARLAEIPAWSQVISSARPAGSAASVPGALDELVDLAVARYRRWAHGSPVLLVHAATRAARRRARAADAARDDVGRNVRHGLGGERNDHRGLPTRARGASADRGRG